MLPDNHKNPLTEKAERPVSPILSGSNSPAMGSCDFFDQKMEVRIRYKLSLISNSYNDKSNTSTPVRTFQKPLEHFQNTQNDGLGEPQDRRPNVSKSNHTKSQVSTGMHGVPVGPDRAPRPAGEGVLVSNLRLKPRSKEGMACRLRNQRGVSGESGHVSQADIFRGVASNVRPASAWASKQTKSNNRKARVLESVCEVSKSTIDSYKRWETSDNLVAVCRKCCIVKILDDFHINKRRPNGHTTHCKQCLSEFYRSEKQKRKARKYNRKRRQLGKAIGIWIWRTQNKEKIKAHGILKYAIQKGTILKPKECDYCGKVTRLHGHHPDYSKPLEVKWFCPFCHSREHHGIISTINRPTGQRGNDA